MNVFGNTPNITMFATGYQQSATQQTIGLVVPMSLLNAIPAATLRVTIGGDDSSFDLAAPVAPATTTPLTVVPGSGHEAAWEGIMATPAPDLAGYVDAEGQSFGAANRELVIDLERLLPNIDLPQVATTTIIVQIPVILNNDSVPLNLWVGDVRILTDVELMLQPGTDTVSIAYGDPVVFVDLLPLRNITIREDRAGAFGTSPSTFWVRIEAPLNYRWHQPAVALANHTGATWGTSNVVINSIISVPGEQIGHLTRNALYVEVTVTGASAFARSFDLSGLELRPEFGNERRGEVSVHVSTLPGVPSQVLPLPFPAPNANRHPSAWMPDGGLFQQRSIVVGNRVATALEAEALGDDLPAIRTGMLNQFLVQSAGFDNAVPAEHVEFIFNEAGIQGLRTAVVEVKELAPGVWSNAFGDRLEFTFEQEGVALVGAIARAGRTADHFDNSDAFQWTGGFLRDAVPATATTPGLPAINLIDLDDIIINPNGVAVQVPSLTDANRFTATRVLQIQFWVSVQGGFAVDNDEVVVTIGGPGATLLPAAQREVVVGIPHDPASLQVVDGAIELSADNVVGSVAQRSLNEIELTIYEPHLLPTNAVINFGIEGRGVNRGLGLHLDASRTAVVGGEGLVLGPVTRANTGDGVQSGNWLQVQILRTPDVDMNDGPITITLTDVVVTGTLVAGVQYYAFAQGTAIVDNLGVGVGRFGDTPYFAEIVSNVRSEGGAREVIISIHDRLPGVDQEPIAFRSITGQNVGLVSARAFAILLGATVEDIEWNAETNTATLRANHVDGRPVVVSYQDGGTNVNVTIGGVPQAETDLARWAGPLTGVTPGNLPVVNINGNTFLPFRAMANIFGYNVEMVTSFSIRFFVAN